MFAPSPWPEVGRGELKIRKLNRALNLKLKIISFYAVNFLTNYKVKLYVEAKEVPGEPKGL
jgi:hypothetical protein